MGGLTLRGLPVDLKVPISIADELTEEVITSNGLLNLASGEIGRIEYEDYDIDTQGLPFESEDSNSPAARCPTMARTWSSASR